MDEQRLQAYIELIEQLLGRPQGQEGELLLWVSTLPIPSLRRWTSHL